MSAAPRGGPRPAAALLLMAALAAPWQATAGAWTQPQGSTLFIGTATFTDANEGLRDGFKTRSLPDYRKLETALLIEHGVTDWLTAIATPTLRWTRVGSPASDSFFGLGYTDLGARVRLWRDDSSVLSVQAVGRIPGAADDSAPAEIGNTDPELDLRVLFGRGFSAGGRPAFVNVEGAYRLRAEEPPNEFRADLTFGIQPAERWLLLAQSFTVVSDGAGQRPFDDYWYTKAQFSAVHELWPGLSLQVGVVTTYAGHNALRETGALIGIWRQF
jgi:hypothetical protein